jgi:DNA-binding transcriptional LysR family regulator
MEVYPMSIDLKKLRYVVEVARAGGITTAANTVCITQSALTRSVAEVEEDLGIQLFQRLPRGVRVTPAGRVFVDRAKQILANMDDLIAGAADFRELNVGRLRIGVSPATVQLFLHKSIVALVQKFPGLGVEVAAGAGEDLIPQVVSGQLDLIVGSSRQLERWPELEVEDLRPVYCVVMVRKSHPLSKLNKPMEKDVLQYPLIQPASLEPLHAELGRMFARNNLPPMRARYICDDFELVKDLVNSTDAFSPVLGFDPEFPGLSKHFTLLTEVLQLSPQSIGMGSCRGRVMTPACQAFVTLLRKELGRAKRRSKGS